MSCASCVAKVEKAMSAVPGVEQVSVNLATSEARVTGRGQLPMLGLLEVTHRVGFEAEPLVEGEGSQEIPSSVEDPRALRRDLRVSIAISLPLMILAMFGPRGTASGLIQGLAATVVLAWPGRRFFTTSWRLLRHGHSAMDTLIALGTGAAWLASWVNLLLGGHLYFESAAMIVTLILIGRVLEGGAKDRAADALRELAALLPATALRIDEDGEESEVPLAELAPGDRLRVRSGSKVPVDGVLIQGEGALDESMLTGESRLVRRSVGEAVTGATLLQDGFFEMRVTAVGEQTAVAAILRLVRDAQGSKAPVQRLADRVASVFVPVVLALSLLTVLLHLLFAPGLAFSDILMRAVTVLVIACPCALGLATPTAILVGSGQAARNGILFREAASLERLQAIRVLAMDKTGTLTRGRPRVARFHAFGSAPSEQLFRFVAAAENAVSHPLADALRDYCQERSEGRAFALAVVSRPGGGVRAEISGKQVLVGAAWYLEHEGVDLSSQVNILEELEENGLSPVLVAVEGRLEAAFGLEDELRPEVPALVSRLESLGIDTLLLSGDRPESVRRTAEQAGITRFEAALRPEEKARRIRELSEGGRGVAMLGDGVNDAPALAAAEVGIALASGTDVAVASAPVTLVHGDLGRVIDALRLSRQTLRTIRENLFWAFFYNLLAIPLAATGVLNPMIAAGAMAASSIFVVTNSLRLRTFNFGRHS
jgi:P-type Cu+ transporter